MGPLHGIKVIELAGLGAGPFAGMLLADMGADVICVERRRAPDGKPPPDCTGRGKRSIALDLKRPAGVQALLRLVTASDVLFESFRPGVAERLGVGPEDCFARNRALVYGRMTGWGQHGPLAARAGHDINYIAISGALHAIGRDGERPVPPLNLVGDYGGGAMFLVTGVLAALLEARRSGAGQVVDAAMSDGSALMMALFHTLTARGHWREQRGVNLLDGGAPFYDVYATRDGKYLALGALEPRFFEQFRAHAGLDEAMFACQDDESLWPAQKAALAAVIASRTRDEWCALFDGIDACVAPVLSLSEAPQHAHNRARETFVDIGGMQQPAPAPRFSRTPSTVRHAAPLAGKHTEAVLGEFGFSPAEVTALRDDGAIG